MTKNIRYNVIFTPEPEGGYTVTIPALPGCVTYGNTLAVARQMAKDAVALYLDSAKDINQSIPTKDNSLISKIDISVPVGSCK